MFILVSITKKLFTIMFLIALTFSSFGISASAVYYTPYAPLTQPLCSTDILGRVLSRVLYSGNSSCNYSNNCNQGNYSNCNIYNNYCDPNANVGKILSVYGDQNTTPSNDVTITVTGKISTSCDNNPVKVFVNMTDQNGFSLISNDSQYINVNSNCNVNSFYFDCTNFTIQILAQKSDFINKTPRVEMSFNPKNNFNGYNNYSYYLPFENSNSFPLQSIQNYTFNSYDCNLYNTCFTNYQIFPIPFGGIRDYEIFTPVIPSGCQLNNIDYFYDSCYFI
jgi:hypothetical protein